MEKIYCIKDTNGRFEGHLNINSNSMVKPNADWAWDYFSQTYPMSGNLIRENAELEVMKLRELNAIAGYDLDWEVVAFTDQEYMNLRTEQIKGYEESGKNPMLYWHYNSSIEMKEIMKGCIGKHRKMVRDIFKKYNLMEKRLVA